MTTSPRLLLFQPRCSGVGIKCKKIWEGTVGGRLKAEFEFLGYTLVRVQGLTYAVRTRKEGVLDSKLQGVSFLKLAGRIQQGALYEDLPPTEQRALFQRAHAKGIMTAHFHIGERSPFHQRMITLSVRVGVGADSSLGRVIRCKQKSADRVGFRLAIDANLDKLVKCVVNRWKSEG